MQDQIVLLEQRKEVTTFLLDDGDVTSKDVVTETGQSIGYDYTNKLYPEDTVTISDKSEIGKEMVKKYAGGNDEIPIGIIPTQIARNSDIRPNHIPKVLAELKAHELVECINPEVRKGRLYRLTDKGDEIVKNINSE